MKTTPTAAGPVLAPDLGKYKTAACLYHPADALGRRRVPERTAGAAHPGCRAGGQGARRAAAGARTVECSPTA